MKNKLYCIIHNVPREVLLGMVMPFPSQFHGFLTPPYPDNDPVLIEDQVIMRSKLYIPINGTGFKFSWDVWVSVKREDIENAFDVKGRKPRLGVSSMNARLESDLIYYHQTLNLAITLKVGEKFMDDILPLDVVEESELRSDQRDGVSMEKVCIWMSKLYGGKL